MNNIYIIVLIIMHIQGCFICTADRCQYLKLLSDALCAYDDWGTVDDDIALETVRAIEDSCYKYSKELAESQHINVGFHDVAFTRIYSSTCFKIISAIGDPSAYLLNCIIDDAIDLSSIAYMKGPDLYPNDSRELREELRARQEQKINRKVSNYYICPKCKQRGAYLYEYQGRAADELSTIRRKCAHCSWMY